MTLWMTYFWSCTWAKKTVKKLLTRFQFSSLIIPWQTGHEAFHLSFTSMTRRPPTLHRCFDGWISSTKSGMRGAANTYRVKYASLLTKARFLHARMLLLRPILAQYCLPQSTEKQVDSLCSRMVMQGSKMCLETAHRTIELIYSHLDSSTVTGPVPAWWYSVLCKNDSGVRHFSII